MTTRNQVWSNNGDIANDLEWPLTAPSAHFCKFWGFCRFYPTHFFRRLKTDIFETSPHDVALLEKRSAAIRISYKCPLSKMGAKKPQISKRKRCYAAKSLHLGRGSSNFDKVWRGYAVRPSWPFRTLKICKFWKSKIAAAAILKIEKSPYLGSSWSDFDEIWHSAAVPPAWPFWPLDMVPYKCHRSWCL